MATVDPKGLQSSCLILLQWKDPIKLADITNILGEKPV
jgi:hypothetical protein